MIYNAHIAEPGLGRVIHERESAGVVHRPGSSHERLAEARGGNVADLPDLLDAIQEDFTYITQGQTPAVAEEALLSPEVRPYKIFSAGQTLTTRAYEDGHAERPEHPPFAKRDSTPSGSNDDGLTDGTGFEVAGEGRGPLGNRLSRMEAT